MKSKEEIKAAAENFINTTGELYPVSLFVAGARWMEKYASQQSPPTTKELIEDCEREGQVFKKRLEELQAQASTPPVSAREDGLINACIQMITAFNDAPVSWLQTQDVIDAEIAIRTELHKLGTTLPPPTK